MATHSSMLPWKMPWTRSLVGYTPWGRRVGDAERLTHTVLQMHGEGLPDGDPSLSSLF